MQGTRRWVWWVVGVLVVLAGGAVAAYVVAVVPQQREENRDAAARQAVEELAAAWQGQDLGALEAFGDGVDYTALTTGVASLAGAADGPAWPEQVAVAEVERDGATATGSLEVRWPFGADGWSYDTTVTAREVGETEVGSVRGAFDTSGGVWEAELLPTTVHPSLGDGAVLASQRVPSTRGTVLGRDGSPLVVDRAVVEIGLRPDAVVDLPGVAATFAGTLGIDAASLVERVQAAGPEEFVPVITLRREQYDPVRDTVRAQTGVVFREGLQPLPPTTAFARATLGRSGPATAELVEASEGRVQPGDTTGLSGLQRAYDEHLAGQAGFSVVSQVGEQSTGLFTQEPVPGADLATTLDERVQVAADQALAAVPEGNGNAALVAVDIPTGDVVAVANTPASGTDRALTGTYPPGSTFKTVSTLALLPTGLTPEETVPCPGTATVEGRAFGNVEDLALGDVPFRTDFARSCNTAFVGLSSRLEPGDLGAAAATLGIGAEWSVGTPVATGGAPAEESPVEQAAASIGQGRVLASPAAMAVATATIARGSWLPPRLVTTPAPEPSAAPAPLDPAAAATVRDLMRAVVTDGSANALLDVPGAPVHAKTGTAEYGEEVPPRTHAWVVGFRGDLAFAALVEDGGSGSRVAVPTAETFLRLLP
ncbi:penicillin-binding transpeptidase domain-containing protein [Aquipuribacter hungaricus]|uniref:Penicillin-binding transpeptidase domain-containing protein n=1 Tax=Aquipuribacter hungaricus TaxID=545624 RepID=A0ABV7WFW0_9MICO